MNLHMPPHKPDKTCFQQNKLVYSFCVLAMKLFYILYFYNFVIKSDSIHKVNQDCRICFVLCILFAWPLTLTLKLMLKFMLLILYTIPISGDHNMQGMYDLVLLDTIKHAFYAKLVMF